MGEAGKVMLSKRLKMLASYIDEKSVVVDIGTDHAHLPIYLLESKKCTKVIASDVESGPIRAAENNIKKHKLERKIDLRQGYGFEILTKDEADIAVIAGMGGGTIKKILERAAKEVLFSVKKLILQPMNDEKTLRTWLILNGWCLKEEDLILENDNIYTIIVTERGKENLYDELILEIGPRLIEKKHPLLSAFISKLEFKYLQMIQGLKKSRLSNSKLKLQRVEEKLKKMKEVLMKNGSDKLAGV